MNTFALPALSDSGLSRYIEQVSQFPMLDEQEEYMLAKAFVARGDIKAAQKMVTSHLRLVVKIAMGFRGYGLPVSDLISEGNIGLMQAVKKFDPEKGFRLSTYAMWWIKAAINEYILRSWSLVKMGTSAAQKKLFFNLKRLRNKIAPSLVGDLDKNQVSQIAEILDVPERDVIEMDQRMNGSDFSLNAAYNDESGNEFIDLVEDQAANQEVVLAEESEHNFRAKNLRKAFLKLNDREQDIIKKRMMLEVPKTLEELSVEYKISRERIRQIEARALEKLRLDLAA